MFGPVSGGHLNPVVSLADATLGGISSRDALAYTPAQISGCILGAIAANAMFAKAALSMSTKHRASPAHLLAEAIATAGLLLVIFSLARTRRISTAPAAVGAYIGGAAAILAIRTLYPDVTPADAAEVVLAHAEDHTRPDKVVSQPVSG